MANIRIEKTNEIKSGEKKKISVNDREILLINIQDTYYALDNKCPHMGGSLYDGVLDGNTIICPRHGAGFDVRTGESTKEAKMAFMKITVDDAKAYPVKVEDGDVLISLE